MPRPWSGDDDDIVARVDDEVVDVGRRQVAAQDVPGLTPSTVI